MDELSEAVKRRDELLERAKAMTRPMTSEEIIRYKTYLNLLEFLVKHPIYFPIYQECSGN